MERLIAIVNSDLVNSKGIESVALALVCGAGTHKYADRLRRTYLTYLCDGDCSLNAENDFSDLSDDSDCSRCSDDQIESSGRHMGALKLPAIRILVSSLELFSSVSNETNQKIDVTSTFWKHAIESMARMLESVNTKKVEVALSIKAIRILAKLEPQVILPMVRSSLLPFIANAKEFGRSNNCRILERESEKLLNEIIVKPS